MFRVDMEPPSQTKTKQPCAAFALNQNPASSPTTSTGVLKKQPQCRSKGRQWLSQVFRTWVSLWDLNEAKAETLVAGLRARATKPALRWTPCLMAKRRP